MTFILKDAVRENVPLLLGLAGGTGSGKTLSALLLAKGLSGGNKFAFIDTESGRALSYADDFNFRHGELMAPFRPESYANAITSIDALKQYSVIVVDSASHEYAGDGGILDWQEEELGEMVRRAKQGGDDRPEWQIAEAQKMRSWIKPKMSHKAFMTRLLQIRSHLILCFRAEPKTEIAKEGKKTVIRDKQGLTGLNGWFPICEKNMPYELTAYFLLMAERPGVPLPIKLMERHKPFFPADRPITEEAGRKLAEWARGGAAGALAGTLPVKLSAEASNVDPAPTSQEGEARREDVPAGSEPVCMPCSEQAGAEKPMVFVPAGVSNGRPYGAFWKCPNSVKGHNPVKHADVLAKLETETV